MKISKQALQVMDKKPSCR